jgi:hypothetical protein
MTAVSKGRDTSGVGLSSADDMPTSFLGTRVWEKPGHSARMPRHKYAHRAASTLIKIPTQSNVSLHPDRLRVDPDYVNSLTLGADRESVALKCWRLASSRVTVDLSVRSKSGPSDPASQAFIVYYDIEIRQTDGRWQIPPPVTSQLHATWTSVRL